MENYMVEPQIVPSFSQCAIKEVACGLHHTVFVNEQGVAYSTGFNENGQLGLGDLS